MNYHKLKAAVESWAQSGIISSAQGEKILALYEHDVPVYKTMRFWLMSLAVILLGFALFLVISANWQHLHWAAQSLIALAPLVAAQFFAIRSEMRDERLNADLGWFAASIALGANIMLQAQIFHISAYYPNGVLFWGIGMAPVLWWRPTTITYLLASVLFVVYMVMQMEHRQFSLLSAIPLIALVRVAVIRQTAINTLALIVNFYVFAIMLMVYRDFRHPGMLWEISHLALALTIVHRLHQLKESNFSLLLLLLSLGFHLMALIATFKSGARWLAGRENAWLPVLVAGVSIVALYRMRATLREKRLTTILLGGITALFTVGLISGAVKSAQNGDSQLLARIGANVVYLGSLVALIFQAIAVRAKRLFLASAFGLLLWTWIRYLDLFQDYLVTALIFAVSAVALIGLNKMWESKYEK
ncbi:MAG TPA: DUF2157 domain-containing protein [Turneriella sp.]|nr:DUF2157 domain-containing protein [Turneriella sp.]